MERLSILTDQQLKQTAVADLMRYLSCSAATRGNVNAAMELFLDKYPRAVHASVIRRELDGLTTKAAVAPGGTADATWAGNLATPTALVEPLLMLVQQESLLGRIRGLRPVPFRTPVPLQTANATFAWVGEGLPKPVSKFGFANVTLPIGKTSGIVVLTEELVRLSQPFGETAMRDALVSGIVQFQDQQLLDPAVAEIANIRPASLTNGVAPVASTGNLQADVADLLAALYASRPGAALPTLVMAPTQAGALAAGGTHPQLTVNGGTAFGVPVVTATGAGLQIVAMDAAAVAFADNGLDVSISREAAVDMNDAPAAPTAATVLTSFWQLNLVGLRVERQLWWTKVPGAVQLLTVPAAMVAVARRPAGKAATQ